MHEGGDAYRLLREQRFTTFAVGAAPKVQLVVGQCPTAVPGRLVVLSIVEPLVPNKPAGRVRVSVSFRRGMHQQGSNANKLAGPPTHRR